MKQKHMIFTFLIYHNTARLVMVNILGTRAVLPYTYKSPDLAQDDAVRGGRWVGKVIQRTEKH